MTIIQANLSHLDQIVPLFDAYRVFYKQPPDIERAKQFIKKRLEQKDSFILIAFAGEQPVGFTQLFYSFSSVSMQPLVLHY